jgi:replicative DNA helicase
MRRSEALKSIGGRDYLINVMLAFPVHTPVKEYCRLLRELALRRELIELGERIVQDAHQYQEAQPIADGATEQLLLLGRTVAKPVVSAFDLAMESLKRVEAIQNGKSIPLVKTGLTTIDSELGGLGGSELIVIAGKSGMGKSALMGSIARNTSFAGVPTLVFSLEMKRNQWVDRMVCDIDFDTASHAMWYSRVRNGRLSESEFERFGAAAQKLHGLPFEIRDEDDVTMQQITATARAFKAKHKGKIGIVFIDYIQIVQAGDVRDRNREQIVNGFARGAKSLAKMLDWPVVVGSQMNEDDKGRAKDEKRPQAGDVRESKGIMNEADIMLSPYREAYYVENRKPLGATPGGVEWITWKNEMDAVKHRLDVLFIKNRSGHKFDAELYADMGASAIRDEVPSRVQGGKGPDAEDVKGLLV